MIKCIYDNHLVSEYGNCDVACHQNVAEYCSIIREIQKLKRLFYLFEKEKARGYIEYVLGEVMIK